jgi:hypothetical protein
LTKLPHPARDRRLRNDSRRYHFIAVYDRADMSNLAAGANDQPGKNLPRRHYEHAGAIERDCSSHANQDR